MKTVADQLREASEEFEGKRFYITPKGKLALKVLGSYRHEPPSLITYPEILGCVAAPLTPEAARSILDAVEVLGIEPAQLTVMKETGEEAVADINSQVDGHPVAVSVAGQQKLLGLDLMQVIEHVVGTDRRLLDGVG